jgi:predicted MPP superfamily phosphohydrolase
MIFANIDPQARERWHDKRMRIEQEIVNTKQRSSFHGPRPWLGRHISSTMNFFVRLSGLYARGRRNAVNVSVQNLDLNFPDLPLAFDGYQILHLSDLHIGQIDDLPKMIREKLSGIKPDLVVVTGDFQSFGSPSAKETAEMVSYLVSLVPAKDGWLAVLGNHDSHALAHTLEAIKVRVLANESVTISRNDDALHLVGIDDVHAFYTPEALNALEKYRENFRIALVHTVDLASLAADLGYNLYLSGHTHGGQVCLPGGRPVITGLDSHRHLAGGLWKVKDMQGYTSRGFGYGFTPYRFNCPPEVSVINFHRG